MLLNRNRNFKIFYFRYYNDENNILNFLFKILFIDYFTAPNLKEKVKHLLEQNQNSSDVNKVIEKMNTQIIKN